jgi:hypothetical protein
MYSADNKPKQALGDMEIYINILAAKTFQVRVYSSRTVLDLKQVIYE